MLAEPIETVDTGVAYDASFWASTPSTLHTLIELGHTEGLFFDGDEAEYVYEVVEGIIASYSILADGRRQILGFFFPGDVVGLTPDRDYHANTCAIGKTKVRSIVRSKLARTLRDRPEIAAKLLESAATQLVGMQNHFVLLGRKCAQEKVATFLYTLAVRFAGRDAVSASFHLPMTRAEIGDYLGLTIETVSRTLTKLRIAGVIDLPQSSKVEIRDLRRLEKLTDKDGERF